MKKVNAYSVFGVIIGTALSHALLFAEVTYELHHGTIDERTLKQLPELAKVYREYPYLYCPNPEQAKKYWAGLSGEDTIWSAAYDESTLVGAMVAIPVRNDVDPILPTHSEFVQGKALMLEEAMVALSYQRQGIGRELIRLLMEDASVQGYTDVYLLTVVRSSHHPLKPKNFIDLDAVWKHLGWQPTHLTGIRTWPARCWCYDSECVALIDNMVEYWHKKL